MTLLKSYLSVLLMVLAVGSQAQQSGIIKGRVLDNDNLSMPGAAVALKSISKGAVSDNYGYYTITGVPAGNLWFLEFIKFRYNQYPYCHWPDSDDVSAAGKSKV